MSPIGELRFTIMFDEFDKTFGGVFPSPIGELHFSMLRELQSRGDYILDYENCDMSLDHVEYHKAEDIDGEKSGDVSDNLYCFFKAV